MNVLIISAHPDDETLGCGGSLLAHRKAGDTLHWFVATSPYAPRWSAKEIAGEKRQVAAVARAYGVKRLWTAGLPTTTLDALPLNDLIEPLRQAVQKARPEIVYSIHYGDVHSDHRRLFAAANAVLKAFYMRRFGVKRWLAFECLSSTEAAAPLPSTAFVPNVYRDITPYLEAKLRVMKLYATQLQPALMPRSSDAIRALARYRGAAIGVKYAEAFSLIREVL